MIYCQGIPIHLYQRRINHLVEHPVPLICMFWVLIHVVPAFSLFPEVFPVLILDIIGDAICYPCIEKKECHIDTNILWLNDN